ncbi:MAG: phosphodiester glycosidase family protein [Limisphaerales bacterium]
MSVVYLAKWRAIVLRVALLVFLAAPTVAEETNEARSGAGYSYHRDVVPDVPWSIQVLKIDRTNQNLQLHTMLANGTSIGLNSIPDQIGMLPPDLGKPIAAINGDYYVAKAPYTGDPKGVQISRGELISAPFDWTCLWIDNAGIPTMGIVRSQLSVTWPNGTVTPVGLNEMRDASKAVLYTRAVGASTFTSGGVELVLDAVKGGKWLPLHAGEEYTAVVKAVHETGNAPTGTNTIILSLGPKLARTVPKPKVGTVIKISTETSPSLKGIPTAISGGPALVRDAEVLVGWSAIRHPRTAVGWNKDFIFFVQVDGRQSGHSVGMTYSELANYMLKLGCEEALNLDGGGSATFWMLGQVINSPSRGQSRDIANGLVLIQKAEKVGGDQESARTQSAKPSGQ